MNKWKLLQALIGVVMGLLFALFLFRIVVFQFIQPTPSLEEIVATAGDWGWLVGIMYTIVQYTWVLAILTVVLITASLYCKIMEIREDGFRPIKLITTIISSVVMVGVMIYLLIELYVH
jgi:hypothetical protein